MNEVFDGDSTVQQCASRSAMLLDAVLRWHRRAKKAIGLAVPMTATRRRKSYRSTAYDSSPAAKVEKPVGGAAAAARRVIADSDDEWPSGIRPLQAGTAASLLYSTAGEYTFSARWIFCRATNHTRMLIMT